MIVIKKKKRDDSHKVTKVKTKRKTLAGTSRDEEVEAKEMTSSLVPWHKSNLEHFPLTLPDIGKHKDVFAVLLRTLKRGCLTDLGGNRCLFVH